MKKFFFLMVAALVVFALTSCQEQEYTFPLDNGMVTLRTASDLSPKQLEAIQKELEVIANKAMTAKEIKISVKEIIKTETETNNFSYFVNLRTGKTGISINVPKPIEAIGLWIFGIAGVFCALGLLYVLKNCNFD